MKPFRAAILIASACLTNGCQNDTDAKVIIINLRQNDFRAVAYKGGVPVGKDRHDENTLLDFYDNRSGGVRIAGRSTVLFEDIRNYSGAYFPWERYDKIVFSSTGMSYPVIRVKEDFILYKKGDREYLYVLTIE